MVVEGNYLTREQYRALMALVCGDPHIGIQAVEIPGSTAMLRALQKRGDQIKIVTSRSGTEIDVIHAWLAERGLSVACVSVGYGKDKVAAVEGFDVYVDDDLPKLLPLVGRIPTLILFSQPHNKGVTVPDDVVRVASWDELIRAARVGETNDT